MENKNDTNKDVCIKDALDSISVFSKILVPNAENISEPMGNKINASKDAHAKYVLD